jgi:GntR family transcriptional regulator/MocR family aminotransferase
MQMANSIQNRDATLFRRLHRSLRDAVLAGRLAAGTRLSSTRALAAELGVSRTTTSAVYDQLVAEGYFTTRRGSGTFVASELPPAALPVARAPLADTRPPALGAWGARVLEQRLEYPYDELRELPRVRYDFLYGVVDARAFPHDAFRRVVSRLLRSESARLLAYTPPEGVPELRAAIATELAVRRGVRCSPSQILITSGAQQALSLIARVLGGAGRRALVEEPCYVGIRNTLAAEGTEIVPVPVDADGMDLERAPSCRGATLAVVTPSHQFPTGSVLSLARRLSLLDWARGADGFVVEDDYDGEFRYEGKPVEPPHALDRDERVIYVGTFSKTLAPALRIGFVVVPERLLRALRAAKWLADWCSPPLEQRALAELVSRGLFERHVRKARARYARRRAALLSALQSEVGDRLIPLGAPAGLHVLCRVPGMSERRLGELALRAREASVGIHSARPCYATKPACAELIFGYARLSEPEIREGIRRLGAAVRSADNRSR